VIGDPDTVLEAFKLYEEPDDAYSVIGFTDERGGFFTGEQMDAPARSRAAAGSILIAITVMLSCVTICHDRYPLATGRVHEVKFDGYRAQGGAQPSGFAACFAHVRAAVTRSNSRCGFGWQLVHELRD